MDRIVPIYTAIGVLCGCLIPITAWILDLSLGGMTPSAQAIIEIHRASPVHFIVDLAPIVLGATFFFLGAKQRHVVAASEALRGDVVERAEALNQSEARIKDFTNIPNQRFWETDEDHVFTYVSGGIGRTFMSTIDDAVGKKRWELPGVRASAEAWRAHKADIAARRPINDFRCTQTDKAGNTTHLNINGRPFFDENDSFRGYRGTTTNITQQVEAARAVEQSEEKYRHLFEFAEDSIFIVDTDTFRFLDVNRAAARRLGYTTEELIGKFVVDINAEDFRPEETARRFVRIREEGSLTFETVHVRKDGSKLPVEISSRFVSYGNREILESIARDITERKEIERFKNEFISTVSHELRTPLTSIIGSLGLMRGNALGEIPRQVRQLIKVAHGNSERLVRLINDILDIEKIESGSMEFEMQPVDLNALVEQAIADNEGYADRFGVILVKDHDVPNASITGDWHRLLQVMANLISNASKFSPAGSRVDVKLTPNGKTVRVAVKDNGPGVPLDFRDTIFDKFTQSDMSDSREKGGTGLGLSISRAIVEVHGGRIGFRNNAEGGATFYFDLPREAA